MCLLGDIQIEHRAFPAGRYLHSRVLKKNCSRLFSTTGHVIRGEPAASILALSIGVEIVELRAPVFCL